MPSTGEPPTPPRRRSGRNPDDVKGVLEEHGVGGSGRRSKAKKSKVDGHAADSAKHRPLFPDPSSKGVPVPTQTANHTKAGGVVPRYQDHTASSQAKARTSRAGSKRPTGRQLSSRHGRGKNSYMDARDVDVAVPRDPRVVVVSTAPKVLPKPRVVVPQWQTPKVAAQPKKTATVAVRPNRKSVMSTQPATEDSAVSFDMCALY